MGSLWGVLQNTTLESRFEGFCGRTGYATSFQVELWGIRRAMKLDNERSWLEAIVETNSLTTVNLINKNDIKNDSNKMLITDCRKLKEAMMLEVMHVLRKGNKCTDYLSKLGRIQREQIMRVMVSNN